MCGTSGDERSYAPVRGYANRTFRSQRLAPWAIILRPSGLKRICREPGMPGPYLARNCRAAVPTARASTTARSASARDISSHSPG